MSRLYVVSCLVAMLAACSNQQSIAGAAAPVDPLAAAAKQGGQYINPHATQQHGSLWGFLKARFRSGPWADYDPDQYQVPTRSPQLAQPAGTAMNPTVTWLGHATVLLQHQGINVLTDPIFSDYASPLSFMGPKRFTPPALELDQLPPIDVVIISHDHYDHLDKPTIRQLGDLPYYVVPEGIGNWLMGQGVARERITELNWWQDTTLDIRGRKLTLTATPAQHFSGRGVTDRNKTLWASWLVGWDNFSVWFGGDTGYNDVQFKAIGQRFPSIDLGIIPIGAYAPRWFMGTVHVNPAEAVRIHQDIGAARSFGIHWGAFLLSAEPVSEPPRLLGDAMAEQSLVPASFDTYAIGESRQYIAGVAASATRPIELAEPER